MAKKLSYLNPTTGANSPDSYWIPVQINMDILNKYGQVTFYGWHDSAARNGGLTHIGQKVYQVNKVQYQQFFSPAALEEVCQNSIRAAYLFAVATLDVPKVRIVEDEEGVSVEETYFVSFFDGAEDC